MHLDYKTIFTKSHIYSAWAATFLPNNNSCILSGSDDQQLILYDFNN